MARPPRTPAIAEPDHCGRNPVDGKDHLGGYAGGQSDHPTRHRTDRAAHQGRGRQPRRAHGSAFQLDQEQRRGRQPIPASDDGCQPVSSARQRPRPCRRSIRPPMPSPNRSSCAPRPRPTALPRAWSSSPARSRTIRRTPANFLAKTTSDAMQGVNQTTHAVTEQIEQTRQGRRRPARLAHGAALRLDQEQHRGRQPVAQQATADAMQAVNLTANATAQAIAQARTSRPKPSPRPPAKPSRRSRQSPATPSAR